jgi:hypothetical protein
MSFGNLAFPKTGEQIAIAAGKRAARLEAKVAERKQRIETTCVEHGVSVADLLVQNNQSLAYNNSVMPMGKQAALQEEATHLQREQQEAEMLRLIEKHIPHARTFDLDFHELQSLDW